MSSVQVHSARAVAAGVLPTLIAGIAACTAARLGAGGDLGSDWTREGAPLLAALVACAVLAAPWGGELARMRLDDQLDALRAMGAGLLRFVVAPRLVAAALALPLLVTMAHFAALLVGGVEAPSRSFGWESPAFEAAHVGAGLLRGAAFGVLIAAVACAAGLAPSRSRPSRAIAHAGARAGGAAIAGVLLLHGLLGGRLPW
jgi:phospholipid/cholesterol/gamma-HCH transport system permease protein